MHDSKIIGCVKLPERGIDTGFPDPEDPLHFGTPRIQFSYCLCESRSGSYRLQGKYFKNNYFYILGTVVNSIELITFKNKLIIPSVNCKIRIKNLIILTS